KKVACRPLVLRRLVKGRAIDEKDVEPSVVVIIDERDSAAHLLEKKTFVLRRAGHIPCAIQAGLGGDVREGYRVRSRHRSGRRQCEEGLCKGRCRRGQRALCQARKKQPPRERCGKAPNHARLHPDARTPAPHSCSSRGVSSRTRSSRAPAG